MGGTPIRFISALTKSAPAKPSVSPNSLRALHQALPGMPDGGTTPPDTFLGKIGSVLLSPAKSPQEAPEPSANFSSRLSAALAVPFWNQNKRVIQPPLASKQDILSATTQYSPSQPKVSEELAQMHADKQLLEADLDRFTKFKSVAHKIFAQYPDPYFIEIKRSFMLEHSAQTLARNVNKHPLAAYHGIEVDTDYTKAYLRTVWRQMQHDDLPAESGLLTPRILDLRSKAIISKKGTASILESTILKKNEAFFNTKVAREIQARTASATEKATRRETFEHQQQARADRQTTEKANRELAKQKKLKKEALARQEAERIKQQEESRAALRREREQIDQKRTTNGLAQGSAWFVGGAAPVKTIPKSSQNGFIPPR